MTQSLARRDTPLIVAHRGASAYAPEHTIAAYELALSQGADLIELDLHLSADDQPVAIHDATLDRTTDGAGPVRERTVKELKRLDAGGWFAPAFRGQRLQTFQEILERFRGRTGFAVELKGGSDLYPGIEERVVSLLEIYGVVEASLVLSFNYGALAKVREVQPGVQTGALIREPADPLGVAPGVATALWFAASLLSEEVVNRTRAAGLDLYAWVVNDAPTIDRLIRWGIRGIVTDKADLVRSRLRR